MVQRIVEDDFGKKLLVAFIERHETPFTVNISTGGRRSIAQNRLQRLWLQEIAEQLPDENAEGWRAYCKLHFGVPILRDADEVFREHYDRVVKPLPYATKLECMKTGVDLPVTSRMNTKQLTQYLDDMHRHFSGLGVVLTIPEDKSLGWRPSLPVEAYEEQH